MSADTVVFGQPERFDAPDTGDGDGSDRHSRPVDHLDVAARLESTGFGDRAAVGAGSADVFAYAASLDLDLGPAGAESRRDTATSGRATPLARPQWAEATSRSVLILAGAVTFSAAGTGAGIGSTTLLVAGVAGWLAGQWCGAPTWRRRGLGDHDGAARVGSWLAVVVAGAALAIVFLGHVVDLLMAGTTMPSVADSGTVVAWVAYAVAAALLGVLGNLSRVAGQAVLTALTGVAGLAIGHPTVAVGAAAALLATTVVHARRVVTVPRGRELRRPDRADLVSARNGAGQGIGLATCLVGVLLLVAAPLRAAVTIAAMSASSLSEPLFVALGAVFGTLARRATTWRRVRWSVAVATLGGLLVLAGATVALSLFIGGQLVANAPIDHLWAAAAAAGAVSVLNGGCALAQRAGRDRTAMMSAVGCGAVVLLAVWWLPSTLGVVLSLVAAVALMTLVAVRAAWQPCNW